MLKNTNMNVKEGLKDKYTSIIKGNKYRKQVVTGKMSKVLFENCSFSGIIFKDMELENVIFHKCTFCMCSFENVIISYYELLVFSNCHITMVDWNNCQLFRLWCIDTVLNRNRFNNTNLYHSIFSASTFNQVQIRENSSLEGVSIIRPVGWLDIDFDNNQGVIKVNEKTKITKFDYKTKVYDSLGKQEIYKDPIDNKSRLGLEEYKSDVVGETLLNFSHQFKLNTLEEQYGKYYYMGKREIHKRLPAWEKTKSFIGLITCGYGERWHYGLLTSIGLIFGFSPFYMLGLELPSGEVIEYGFTLSAAGLSLSMAKVIDYGHSLYFSAMTFILGNYSDIQPVGVAPNVLSFLEMVLGIILIAIITGSILRKMFR